MKSPPALVLASTSIYRRELLARLRIPFECQQPGVDETPLPGENACELAARLARSKARAVAQLRPDAWVIGGDQVALLQDAAASEENSADTILGKPDSVAACIDQLLQCSGRTLRFVTAIALVRHRDAVLSECIDTTRVTFRTLELATIERYVALESPLDCTGGFKSEGLGITLCDSIATTDPTALIGLPLIRTGEMLRSVGFHLP